MTASALAPSRSRLATALVATLVLSSCSSRSRDVAAVKAAISRYDELLVDGYQRQNMSFMREVASEEQATKLYAHMAALGEGNLRLSSSLRELRFVRVDIPAPGEATAETREVWDFTHYRIATGEKFAEEKGFVYRMAYCLRKQQGRWLITRADVIAGEPGNTTIPWPGLDRSGGVQRPGSGAAVPPQAPREPGR